MASTGVLKNGPLPVKRTRTGRVVYKRKKRSFSSKDILRIIRKVNQRLTAEDREAIIALLGETEIGLLDIVNSTVLLILDAFRVGEFSLGQVYAVLQDLTGAILGIEPPSREALEELLGGLE